MLRHWLALTGLILPGCTMMTGDTQPGQAQALPNVLANAGVTTPATDHHQHLFSPTLADLVNGEGPKRAIDLPPDLEGLLQLRSERWNDAAALEKLYASDSLILGRSRSGWIRGASKGAAFLASFARAYHLTPVELRLVGSQAHIGGYYSRGDKAAPQHIGFFQMSAEKGPDGNWRITQETPVFPFPQTQGAITAADLIKMMDEARIRRAVVLSEGFWLDSPLIPLPDSYAKVRAENDWTLSQAAQFPERLIPFCSFSPIADHALQELARCSASPGFKGLKFSFAMSRLDLLEMSHVERLKSVFAEANRRGLPLVVHLTGGPGHGSEHVRVFVNQVMPSAPDVPVQIAHLWGGEGFSGPALAALADAVEQGVPGSRNLCFDLAEVWTAGPDHADTIAHHIRRIGLDRIVYGSDAALNGRLKPRQAWSTLRAYLPLHESEFRQIAGNEAPYLK